MEQFIRFVDGILPLPKVSDETEEVLETQAVKNEAYIELPRRYFNASSDNWQLTEAKKYLEKENATKDNQNKELKSLYRWLSEITKAEIKKANENIDRLDEIMKDL